jgi:hypothetical protein
MGLVAIFVHSTLSILPFSTVAASALCSVRTLLAAKDWRGPTDQAGEGIAKIVKIIAKWVDEQKHITIFTIPSPN